MAKALIATTGSGLDPQFATAAAGLYCTVAGGEMPVVVNAYRLKEIAEKKPELLAGVKFAILVGIPATDETKEMLGGIPCQSFGGLHSEKSGARMVLESKFGKEMAADRRWKNLAECALLADIQFNGAVKAKEWADSRALALAFETYGKTPWKSPDDFLTDWKLVLEDEDAFRAMKDSGQAMADYADGRFETQIRSNGGLLDFADSTWICYNGFGGRLQGWNVYSPADHGGLISWQWCPREKAWRVFFEKDGSADIEAALEASADCIGTRKPVTFRDRWAVAYMDRLPFRLQDIRYFWKF